MMLKMMLQCLMNTWNFNVKIYFIATDHCDINAQCVAWPAGHSHTINSASNYLLVCILTHLEWWHEVLTIAFNFTIEERIPWKAYSTHAWTALHIIMQFLVGNIKQDDLETLDYNQLLWKSWIFRVSPNKPAGIAIFLRTNCSSYKPPTGL